MVNYADPSRPKPSEKVLQLLYQSGLMASEWAPFLFSLSASRELLMVEKRGSTERGVWDRWESLRKGFNSCSRMSILSYGICCWLIWRVLRWVSGIFESLDELRRTDSLSWTSQDLVETIGFLFMLGSLELGRVSLIAFPLLYLERQRLISRSRNETGLRFFGNDCFSIASTLRSSRLWISLSYFRKLSPLFVSFVPLNFEIFIFVSSPTHRFITQHDSLLLSPHQLLHSSRLYTVNQIPKVS